MKHTCSTTESFTDTLNEIGNDLEQSASAGESSHPTIKEADIDIFFPKKFKIFETLKLYLLLIKTFHIILRGQNILLTVIQFEKCLHIALRLPLLKSLGFVLGQRACEGHDDCA